MSELADRARIVKRSWAAPGGFHDIMIGVLKMALPILIGLLGAYLVLAPLSKGQEISFILDKNKVDVAEERMRVQGARYQGQDDGGRPFTLAAKSAVQANSREQVVDIDGMAARILLADGPATLTAGRGRYDIESQRVAVPGAILFTASDGYRLRTQNVTADLNKRILVSQGRSIGRTPLGIFAADRLVADLPSRRLLLTGNVQGRTELGTVAAERGVAYLPERRVVLTGRARLHIVQGVLR